MRIEEIVAEVVIETLATAPATEDAVTQQAVAVVGGIFTNRVFVSWNNRRQRLGQRTVDWEELGVQTRRITR